MGSIDFQNGFIAGVSTQGAFPLGLRGFKEEDEGKFLKVEDGKVGLGENIELSRVNAQIDSTGIQLEDGQLLEVRDGKIVGRSRNEMKNRFFLFIGDSYAAGYGDPNIRNQWYYDGNQWPNFAAKVLGLKEEDYAIFAQGGSGLVTYGENGYSFEKLIKFAVDKHEDDTIPGYCHYSTYPINGEKVTDIVIGGGYNDKWTTAIDVFVEGTIKNENTKERYENTGMRSLYQTIKTFYPNARIHFFNLGWDMDGATRFGLQVVSQSYYAAIARFNTSYVNLSYKLHNRGLISYDGFHPNKIGEEVLGTAIANILLGGEPEEREYFPVGVKSSVRKDSSYIDSFSHKGLYTFFFAGTEFLASNLSQEGFSHSFVRYADCDGVNYSIQNPEYSVSLIDLGEIVYGNNVLRNGSLGMNHFAGIVYEDGTAIESPAQLHTGVMKSISITNTETQKRETYDCFVNYTTSNRPDNMTVVPHLYLHLLNGFDTTKKIKKISIRQCNDVIGIESL